MSIAVDIKARKELFLTLSLFQLEIHQLKAKVETMERLLKAHPELYGDFQTYDRERLDALQNPRMSSSLDANLEELRRSLNLEDQP